MSTNLLTRKTTRYFDHHWTGNEYNMHTKHQGTRNSMKLYLWCVNMRSMSKATIVITCGAL